MGCSCVTPGQQQARELSWLDGSAPEALSADGRTVLLSEMLRGAGPNGAIYLRKTDGSDAVRRGDGFGDDLSPDGKWVLASPVPWRQHWILVPTGPGSPRILPPGPLVALGDARFWPNGRQIVFGGREKDRGARIYVQDIEVSAVSFRDFVLDLDTRELRRGGDSVSLSPKAYQLLEVLVVNRPKALSKSVLQERLWPDTFVLEKNLVNLVAEVREALGDDATHPRFVRTVQRFGYAFRRATPEAPAAGEPIRRKDARFRIVWPGGRAALTEGEYVLGRDPDLELFLDAPDLSRRHARIRIAGEEATVLDHVLIRGARPRYGDVIDFGLWAIADEVARIEANFQVSGSDHFPVAASVAVP
jgi:DNA-binding winged helix-turn-helix (wHTH) protein